LVTEAMSAVLGDRVIGICDSPMAMCRRVARALGVDAGRAWFDYVGLNHLGWLRAVLVDGRDRMPGLLADEARLRSFEEGRLFDAGWLHALGAVPNEYLWYWYAHREAVAAVQTSGGATRGTYLREQQERFYAAVEQDPSGAWAEWQRVRRERDSSYMAEARPGGAVAARDEADVDGGGYERVALGVLAAIARNDRSVHILDVRNRGSLPGLDDEAVVEVPCLVDANGAHPVAAGALEPHQLGLLQAVKAVERETIAAAVEGSRERALRAFALHPLVDSVDRARALLAGYLEAAPELARQLH
jgi:6-phospho-beta-glucosidase